MKSYAVRAFARPWLALVLGLFIMLPAKATSFGTNWSDVWWNPNENGWGIQFVQNADVIFATMYVYDAPGAPTFYVATLNYVGNDQYSGTLYATRGPWFGNPIYNPNLYSNRPVGQMTFFTSYVDQGQISYTVEGVPVTKTISRYTLRNDNYAGSYLGAYKTTSTKCFNPANNGTQIIEVTFNVTQGPNSMRVAATGSGFACVYQGDYQQDGQLGSTQGTFSCTTGESGNYLLFEMNANYADLRGRLSATNNVGCTLTGDFAALRQ